jgi:hypothetical protein
MSHVPWCACDRNEGEIAVIEVLTNLLFFGFPRPLLLAIGPLIRTHGSRICVGDELSVAIALAC